MSEDEYSSNKEECRMNRSQRRRRAHNMSSDEDEEGDDVVSPSSPGQCHTDENGVGQEEEEEPAEEVPAKDMAGPQLNKEAVAEAMKNNRRVEEITPNMVLNQAILEHCHNVRPVDQDQGSQLIIFHHVLLGHGTWTKKTKKKMREKYFIAREQYIKMEPPTLKARPSFRSLGLKTTSPPGNQALLDTGSPSATLLGLHQVGTDSPHRPNLTFSPSRG